MRFMSFRLIATLVIGLALALPGTAGAASGPKRVQTLAAAQTVYLFAHLTGVQSASPRVCGAGQPSSGFLGFFLLPTLSFSPGDKSFDCRISTRTVVLDLSGSTVTEDANVEAPYEFEDGTELLFLPGNLERICDDVGPRFFPNRRPPRSTASRSPARRSPRGRSSSPSTAPRR